MSGPPIMIRRVGIAWLVSPWQDLHPHDAGEDRCGQKTKCARSKIGQTRCLPLWISNSPFRIIDGGSCSISLVVNQSVGSSLTHTPWPRTSLPSQWLSRRGLHIVYTQPENMFCLGTRNMPPFKDWVICFSSDARLPQFVPPDLISRTSYFCQVNSSGCIDRLFLIQGEALSAYVDKHSLHTWGEYFGEEGGNMGSPFNWAAVCIQHRHCFQ